MKRLLVILPFITSNVYPMNPISNEGTSNQLNDFEQLPAPLKADILMRRILSDIQSINLDTLSTNRPDILTLPGSVKEKAKALPSLFNNYIANKEFKAILDNPVNARKIVDALKAKLGNDFILKLIPYVSAGFIDLLIKGGINPNEPYPYEDEGRSKKPWDTTSVDYALAKAARENKPDIVKLLLKYGADVKAKATVEGKSAGRTALQLAAQKGDLEVVEVLLSHPAITKDDKSKALSLVTADNDLLKRTWPNSLEIKRLDEMIFLLADDNLKANILKKRILNDIGAIEPKTLLIAPNFVNDKAKVLLSSLNNYVANKEFKANLDNPFDARDIVDALKAKLGNDFILQLIPHVSAEFIDLLLKGRIDPNAPYQFEDIARSQKPWDTAPSVDYALAKAARENKPDIVKLLLKYGADVKAKATVEGKSAGRTALQLAAQKGNSEVVKALLSHPAITKDDRSEALILVTADNDLLKRTWPDSPQIKRFDEVISLLRSNI